jgi:hypothetical protein
MDWQCDSRLGKEMRSARPNTMAAMVESVWLRERRPRSTGLATAGSEPLNWEPATLRTGARAKLRIVPYTQICVECEQRHTHG